MQLVLHVERMEPPGRTPLCEAAAVAVVRLVADARAQPGGEWHAPVDRWLSQRIRKHCRRARGVAWERVQDLPGVTVEVSGTQVRALVPTSTADIPGDVARLQLSGRELNDPDIRSVADPDPGGPVVVSLNPDPALPLGKAAAAAGHAAQLALLQMPPDRLSAWAGAGYPVVVEHPDRDRWLRLCHAAQVQVLDAGLTVVTPGTCTALARWH
jgi:peptidyl-tRNA hydrolase